MNIDEIKEIIAVLENTGIVEFELETSGVKVRIKRGENQDSGVGRPSAVEKRSAPEEALAREEKRFENKILIKSPIVGTYYRSASPEAEPYVEVGSIVKKGQIVCIIEAMKLMNEIESDADGKIVAILTENAQPVEYGEPLFAIEPI